MEAPTPDNPQPLGPSYMRLYEKFLPTIDSVLELPLEDLGTATIQRRDDGTGLAVLVNLGSNKKTVTLDDGSRVDVKCVNYTMSADEVEWQITAGGCTNQTARTRNAADVSKRQHMKASMGLKTMFRAIEFSSTDVRGVLNQALYKAMLKYSDEQREAAEEAAYKAEEEARRPKESWLQRNLPGLF